MKTSKKKKNSSSKHMLPRPNINERTKFLNFVEKCKRLSANPIKLLKDNDVLDGSQTNFSATLEKWKLLNVSTAYTEFIEELGGNIRSVKQLLFHHKHIMSVIHKYLRKPSLDASSKEDSSIDKKSSVSSDKKPDVLNSSSALIPKDSSYFMDDSAVERSRYDDDGETTKALEPLLELIVALAIDIPKNFYTHHLFPTIPYLISHTHTKIPEQIEHVFKCFTSILTAVEKHIKTKDIYKLFTCCFVDLLSSRRPWYINDLAAQTLGFLVRKISDKQSFLECIFKHLTKDPSFSKGLGKLLTSLMKSNTINRVHIATSDVLKAMFNILLLKELPTPAVFEALSNGLKGLMMFVTNKNSTSPWQNFWKEDNLLVWGPVWSDFTSAVKEYIFCSDYYNVNEEGDINSIVREAEEKLIYMLRVVQLLVNYKKGALLLDVDVAYNKLLSVFVIDIELVGDCVVEIALDLLNSPVHQPQMEVFNLHHPEQIKRNNFISSLFKSKFPLKCLFDFTRGSLSLPHFDQEILPQALQLLSKCGNHINVNVRNESLMVLLDIVISHQPNIKTASDLDSWKSYELQIVSSNEFIVESFTDFIQVMVDTVSVGLSKDLSNCEQLLACLICLPHIRNVDHEQVASFISRILHDISCRLNQKKINKSTQLKPTSENDDNLQFDLNVDLSIDEQTQKTLMVLNVAVETMAHTLAAEEFLFLMSGINIVNILKCRPQLRENQHLLRAVDLYLTLYSHGTDSCDNLTENPLTSNSFTEMYTVLAPSLASPHPQTRLLVTHILSLFPLHLPPPAEGTTPSEGLFSIMYQIESRPITALNFNERLRLMSLIDVDHISAHSPVSGICAHAPVLFAIGQLYVNLNLIWGYTRKFLAEYANKLPQKQFWSLWLSKLKSLSAEPEQTTSIFSEESALNSIHEYLIRHEGYSSLSQKINHLVARDSMWQTMLKFPSLCEVHSDDIVSSFYDFISTHMKTVDFSEVPTQNLRVSEHEDNLDDFDDNEEDAVQQKKTGKFTFSLLCNYLQLFSKFANIRKLSSANKLEKLFMDLLVHPSDTIRGYAIACLFAFKHKYIKPYEEIILRIHNDRTFKSGVASFSIDALNEDDASINKKHRTKFMQFYIRFIYGKMQTKVGKNTSGKLKVNERKALIMRLLAGITDDESECLLNLAFEILLPYLEGSTLDIVNKVFDGIDATKCIPLKRLSGMLGTLDNLLGYLGNLLPTKKGFFLKLILMILSYVTVLKDQNEDIAEKFTGTLKNLKTQAMNQLLKFLNTFEEYPWSVDEVDALFKAAIWPTLAKLSSEGVTHVHPLLKMFKKWSETDKLQSLFIKHHPNDKTLSPLNHIFKLTASPKCKAIVVNYVLEIVYNLIDSSTTIKEVPDVKLKTKKRKRDPSPEITPNIECETLPCRDLLPVLEPVARVPGEAPSYGLKILLPHTSQLTKCMLGAVRTLSKKTDSTHHLKILCELTRYVVNNEDGDELLRIIIPTLVRKKTSDLDVVIYLLQTCAHLLPISNDCDFFCCKLLPLFHSLPGQECRTSLCHVFKVVGKTFPKYACIASFMYGFNSYEETVSESIDIGKRLDAYKDAISYLKSLTCFDKTLFLFLMNQCSHDVHTVKDVTLSEGSLRCCGELIRAICKFSSSDSVSYKQIMDVIFTQIKQGIKSESDEVHCLYLKLLKVAVVEAGSSLKALKDYTKILNFDPKFDFFTQITHLQMLRRAQAVNKITNAIREGVLDLKTDTLEAFIWPLVCRYLTQSYYASEQGLLAASVSCVGLLAKKLPWQAYCKVLKYFLGQILGKIHNAKVGLRVVSIILDAFHEDVSELVFSKPRLSKPKVIKKQLEGQNNTDEKSDDVQDEKSETIQIEVSKAPPRSKNEEHARKVYSVLIREIIPGLKRVFESRSKETKKHKVNKDAATVDEDDEVKKIPLALPLVKLLKKFPPRVLDANLNNIVYHLITFLKSRKHSVRRQAMEMMAKILEEVGSKYLPQLLRDLHINLNMGFMRHVLIYTLRKILIANECSIKARDLAPCIEKLMQICMNELFSEKNQNDKSSDTDGEKQTTVEEAEGIKSYAILRIIGKFIKAGEIKEVMIPLKDVLSETHKKSSVVIVQNCLNNLLEGLKDNKVLSINDKSIFIYGILNDKIEELKQQVEADSRSKSVWDIPDRLLLEPEPKRIKLSAKTALSTNCYVFAQFAFSLLNRLLRSNAYLVENKDHNALLDPFVNLIGEFFHSPNPEISIECLKCFSQLIKHPLPSLKGKISSLAAQMFVLLNKYSSSELEKGQMYDLVQLTFSSLATLIKSVPYYIMQEEHMRVLLIYMKESLGDNNHQQMVFSLLHAIISKKIDAPEIVPLMDIVKRMIVKETVVGVLDQARSVYFQYLLNYTVHQARFINIFNYFVENLDYAEPQGRISVCLMLDNLIANLPSSNFKQADLKKMWMQLLLCLVKEEDSLCKKHQQYSLHLLFKHAPDQQFFIKESLQLMKEKKKNTRTVNATHVRLGCLSFLSFIGTNNKDVTELPVTFLTEVLPCVTSLLHSSRYEETPELEEDIDKQLCIDSSLLELLKLFGELFVCYNNDPKGKKYAHDKVWEHIVGYLTYAEMRVRLLAGSLLGKLFEFFPIEKSDIPHIISSPEKSYNLIMNLVEQFRCTANISDEKYSELYEMVIRNLVYIIRQSSKTAVITEEILSENSHLTKNQYQKIVALVDVVQQYGQVPVCASFVMNEIAKPSYEDILKKRTVRREAVLNLIAAVTIHFGENLVNAGPAVQFIMSHFAREDRNAGSEKFLELFREVNELVKETLGWDNYSKLLHEAESVLAKRRMARRINKKERLLKNQS